MADNLADKVATNRVYINNTVLHKNIYHDSIVFTDTFLYNVYDNSKQSDEQKSMLL